MLGAKTTVTDLTFTRRNFFVRALMHSVGTVSSRHDIVESSRLPFVVFLDKSRTDLMPIVVGSVNAAAAYGWRWVDSLWTFSA